MLALNFRASSFNLTWTIFLNSPKFKKQTARHVVCFALPRQVSNARNMENLERVCCLISDSEPSHVIESWCIINVDEDNEMQHVPRWQIMIVKELRSIFFQSSWAPSWKRFPDFFPPPREKFRKESSRWQRDSKSNKIKTLLFYNSHKSHKATTAIP